MTRTTSDLNDTVGNLKNYLEVIGKTVLGFLAVSYAVGLIVESVYFSRYGITAFTLLRLNYVIAGIWVLMPYFFFTFWFWLIWAFCPLSSTSKRYDLLGDGPIRSPWIAFALTSLTVSVLLLLVAGTVVWVVIGNGFNDDWIVPIIISLLTSISINDFLSNYPSHKANINSNGTGRLRLAISGLTMMALPIIYCVIAGPVVYHLIPAEVGGGKFRNVTLLVRGTKSTFDQLIVRGLQLEDASKGATDHSESDRLTFNSRLIFVTETDYFILLSNNTTISISRDLVKAASY